MEAPTVAGQASNANRPLDLHTVPANGKCEVVEAVACSPHLSNEHFPQRRALLHQRQHHDPCCQELFNSIATDKSRAFHYLRSHEGCRANVLEEETYF